MSGNDFNISENEISHLESVDYTRDILISLQKMASVQKHTLLAHLLSLAAEEARMLKNDYRQDTLPPG